MLTITARISCNDLIQIVAEMEEALPLYSIVEDPEVVRHNRDAGAQRCNNGEDQVALDFTVESAANFEDRLWTRTALRAADAAMVDRAAALSRVADTLREARRQ